MRLTLKALGMAAIAILAGVGSIVYATATSSEDGFIAGTGGGVTIGYTGVGNTASAGELWLKGTSGTIYFSTSAPGDDEINMSEGSDTLRLGGNTDTNPDSDYILFGNGDDGVLFGEGDDYVNLSVGSDALWMGTPEESTDDVDMIHFGAGNDCIYFDPGDDRIYFGDSTHTTGNRYSHYVGYTDAGEFDQESAITVQAPTIALQSFNEGNPDDSNGSDDYVGASIEIDPQDANGRHTGDVIITLGAGE